MKTTLITLGLAVVFFGIGLAVTSVVLPRLAGGAAAADSSAASETAAAESVPRQAATPADVGNLATDLSALNARLAAAEARADSLRTLLDAQRAESRARSTDVSALAATLTGLEDEALAQVVQKLDGRSFIQLYESASARNQRRLLQALTPAQAAAFVRHQLPGGSRRAAADTAAS